MHNRHIYCMGHCHRGPLGASPWPTEFSQRFRFQTCHKLLFNGCYFSRHQRHKRCLSHRSQKFPFPISVTRTPLFSGSGGTSIYLCLECADSGMIRRRFPLPDYQIYQGEFHLPDLRWDFNGLCGIQLPSPVHLNASLLLHPAESRAALSGTAVWIRMSKQCCTVSTLWSIESQSGIIG